MDEFKESTKINIEKQSRQEIIDFLGLNKAPNLAKLQDQFNFVGELRPWWLEEKEGEVSDRLRLNHRAEIKGFVDPVAVLQSELKKNPKSPFEEIELIYPRLVLTRDGVRKIPPSLEMISEAVAYLQKIGFHPSNPIRGENWVLKGRSWPGKEPEKLFPTIYENIEVKVVRDGNGKAESVNLYAFKQK